jgi:hypothetical protein
MMFFVPSEDDAGELPSDEAEKTWHFARRRAEIETGGVALDRRIYRLDYRDDGRELSAVVGGIDGDDEDLIVAIVAFPDVYSVRCRHRGVLKGGEPILVGEGDVRQVVEFARTAERVEASVPRQCVGHAPSRPLTEGSRSRLSATALTATITLDPDMEIAPTSGRSTKPTGSKMPAAMGIASEL